MSVWANICRRITMIVLPPVAVCGLFVVEMYRIFLAFDFNVCLIITFNTSKCTVRNSWATVGNISSELMTISCSPAPERVSWLGLCHWLSSEGMSPQCPVYSPLWSPHSRHSSHSPRIPHISHTHTQTIQSFSLVTRCHTGLWLVASLTLSSSTHHNLSHAGWDWAGCSRHATTNVFENISKYLKTVYCYGDGRESRWKKRPAWAAFSAIRCQDDLFLKIPLKS